MTSKTQSGICERSKMKEQTKQSITKQKIPTRKKILLAAEEVFSESGYHKTLVEDIAARAGLGKGTIYRYFATKKELFLSLMFESLDELREIIKAATDKHTGTIDKLKAGIEAYLGFFKRHKQLFVILIYEHNEVGCGENDDCLTKFTDLIGEISDFARGGIADGTFKELDPVTLSYGMLGTLNYVIFKWMMSPKEYDIMDELDTIYELILRGAQR